MPSWSEADLALSGGRRYVPGPSLKRDVLVPWIESQPWHYFLTVTYRTPRTPERFLVEAQRIEQTLLDSAVSHGLLVPEEHKSGLLHVHGLARGNYVNYKPSDDELYLDSFAVWQRLFTRYGRSEVERIRSSKAVTAYCAKYVMKDLTSNYWVW